MTSFVRLISLAHPRTFLLYGAVLRREGNDPAVVAATKVKQPTWVVPKLALSSAEAARYHAAQHRLFAAAEAELRAAQKEELAARCSDNF